MAAINKITQKTNNRFVNLYDLDVTHRNGQASHYYVASRAKTEDELKIRTGENHPDGVIIYSLYGPERDKVVLIRQYRYPIGGYVYEFPAGLVEIGESCATVYGYADGKITDKYLEGSEELEIVLADRDEIKRILKEEKVAIMCAYQLMHFLVDEEPFRFLMK